jgi:hypothetical protein
MEALTRILEEVVFLFGFPDEEDDHQERDYECIDGTDEELVPEWFCVGDDNRSNQEGY